MIHLHCEDWLDLESPGRHTPGCGHEGVSRKEERKSPYSLGAQTIRGTDESQRTTSIPCARSLETEEALPHTLDAMFPRYD